MQKSPAKLILLSLCFQGLTLVPAFAQAVVSADGRVGVPTNAAVTSTPVNVPTTPSAGSKQHRFQQLHSGTGGQITVRVFAADDIPDKPAQINNDGMVTLPMIGEVHAAGLTVEQLQASW